MKYIRTKDGKIYELQETKSKEKYLVRTNELIPLWNTNEYEVLKEADTIEELIDEYVLREKANCKLDVDYAELTEDDVKLCLQDHDIFGAIWVNGDKEEPILKSVAKMNEKGELELL